MFLFEKTDAGTIRCECESVPGLWPSGSVKPSLMVQVLHQLEQDGICCGAMTCLPLAGKRSHRNNGKRELPLKTSAVVVVAKTTIAQLTQYRLGKGQILM